MQTLLQTISRPRYVFLAAVVIAMIITVIMLRNIPKQNNSALSYKCFKTDNGWGYDIMVNKKIVIHQDLMGSFPGAAGFSSEQQAKAVAAIVIEKIKSGKIPAISREELQQLGVLSTP